MQNFVEQITLTNEAEKIPFGALFITHDCLDITFLKSRWNQRVRIALNWGVVSTKLCHTNNEPVI